VTEILQKLSADIFFLGADAIDRQAVTNSTVDGATLKASP
jgi:DeoR/GlpR family transcriptional regulator of sugar metabolism